MDYETIAEELLSIRSRLLHVPANQMMNEFVRGELFVLNYLLIHNGRAFPKDLSRSMDVSSARIAVLLNQMARKGWIVRAADTEDCRQTVITLTDVGRREVTQKRVEIVEAVVQMLKNIGQEDAKELLRIERKIMGL